MRPLLPAAGNPDAHRFRQQRRRGGAAFRSAVSSLAVPRSLSLGAQTLRISGGDGAGAGLTGSIPVGGDIPAGDPATGHRYKIIGLYRVGSTDAVIG